MSKSVKLGGPPNWFNYIQDAPKTAAMDEKKSPGVAAKLSVNLGPKQEEQASSLPLKQTLKELLSYKDGILAKQLLHSNTFFQGKIGFHELIIKNIFEAVGTPIKEIDYFHAAQNLPRERKPERLILLPNVKSEEALNDFVAQSLRHKSKVPVWLVANPSSVYKHLLLGFHNFFIASNNPDEIKYLQNVFSLPKVTIDLLLSNEREAVFITDYEPVINKSGLPIAIVRIERLY